MEMNFKSLLQLADYFKEESTCKEYLVQQRWNGNPVCPHCGSAKIPYVTQRGYRCSDKDCAKKFTVTTGTAFESSKIPLRTWYAAIFLVTFHKKGISSVQLSRDLNLTQKTAWFMLHRIRVMLKSGFEILSGQIEADEMRIGGEDKNKHENKRNTQANGKACGPNSGKIIIAGALQRGGNVITSLVENTKSESLIPFIANNVLLGSTIITDELGSYNALKYGFEHRTVNHSKKEYVCGWIHTNGIENFWSVLGRTIYGTYHIVTIKKCNARLKYKDLTN